MGHVFSSEGLRRLQGGDERGQGESERGSCNAKVVRRVALARARQKQSGPTV